MLDRLQPSVSALVTQIESHSDHKPPPVDFATDECLADSTGRFTLPVNGISIPAGINSAIGTNGFGPCGASEVQR